MMNKKTTITVKTILPDELVEVILLKLPYKSLVRFRCVSKSWNTLLTNQDFIDKNHNYSKLNPTNLKLLIQTGSLSPQYVEEFNNYGFSGNLRPVNKRVYGSCKGLILLCSTYDGRKTYSEKIRLVNPSTGECKVLPIAPSKKLKNEDHAVSYGFAYSEVSQEYKVIRIGTMTICKTQGYKYCIPAEVTVYSLSTNTWRKVEPVGNGHAPYIDLSINGSYLRHRAGVFLNGALHWIATNRQKEECIIAFDIEDGKFCKLLCPFVERSSCIRVSTLEGKLCLTVGLDRVSEMYYAVLFVMENYGLRNSWTELFRVESMYPCELYGLLPLCRTWKEKGVLVYDGDLTFYNLVDMSITKVHNLQAFYDKTIEIDDYLRCFPPTIYTESLISFGAKERRGRRLKI